MSCWGTGCKNPLTNKGKCIVCGDTKPRYKVFNYDAVVIGIRQDFRNDGMAEMHIIEKQTGKHYWEIAPFIGAMDLVRGKSGMQLP